MVESLFSDSLKTAQTSESSFSCEENALGSRLPFLYPFGISPHLILIQLGFSWYMISNSFPGQTNIYPCFTLTGILGCTSCRGNCCPHNRHHHSLSHDGKWRKRVKETYAGRCLLLPVSSCLEWARAFFWPEVPLERVEQGEAGEVQKRSEILL